MAHTTPEERSATGGSVPALDRAEVVPLLSQSFSAKPASPTRAAQEESARGPSSQLRESKCSYWHNRLRLLKESRVQRVAFANTRGSRRVRTRSEFAVERVKVQLLAQSTEVVERVKSATSGTIDLSVTSLLSSCTSEARRTSTLLY